LDKWKEELNLKSKCFHHKKCKTSKNLIRCIPLFIAGNRILTDENPKKTGRRKPENPIENTIDKSLIGRRFGIAIQRKKITMLSSTQPPM